MFSKSHQEQILRHRLLIFIITTAVFIAAFVLNIVMNQPLYNLNLNVVPDLQNNSSLGSYTFLSFMNVISNLFNPIVCAAYIILFWLISYRKLQILVFLVWFIFLAWVLSLLKMIFHQARPYWVPGSGVQMLQWTCYTEYGMPSGHSMMAIILLQFIVRFYARVSKCVSKGIVGFYILILILQLLVMFSRVILGMHSFNQVLLGCLIGCYTFVPYYLFIERWLLKWVLRIFRTQKSPLTTYLLFCIACISICASLLIALLVTYNNQSYALVIGNTRGCEGFVVYKSFQYKCLEDSALLMAAIGILFSFNYIKNPSYLNLKLDYTRISWKWLAKIIITLIFPAAVLAIFMNPLWNKIILDDESKSLVLWACQICAFFLSTFFLIYVIPLINHKFGFQVYKIPQSYDDFKQHQVINMIQSGSFVIKRISKQNKKRETELTDAPTLVVHQRRQQREGSINQSFCE